jgi:hypothetical protein
MRRGWVGVGTGIQKKWLDRLVGFGLGDYRSIAIRAVVEAVDGSRFETRYERFDF